MRRWPVLALLAACGNPANHADAGGDGIDAPAGPQVSGQLIELVADNDASLQTETRIVSMPPARVTMSALLDDGSTVTPTVTEGLFAFPLAQAGQHYGVTIAFDGGVPTTFVSTAPSLILGTSSIGRIDRVPATKPTQVTVAVPNFSLASGDFALFDSTGVWMQAGMTLTSAAPPTFTIDTGVATSWFDGKASLFSAAEHDHPILAEFRPNPGGLNVMVAALPLTLTTMDGVATSTSGNVSANGQVCLAVNAPRAQDMNRYLAALPNSYSTFTDVMFIESPMGSGFGPAGAMELATQVETSNAGSVATNFAQSIQFLDAFGTSHVVIEMSEGLAQHVTPAIIVDIGTTTFIDVPLVAGCGPANVPAAMPAIPSFASVAGTSLTADTTIQLDATAPVTVSWDVAASGAVDFYTVQLFEVTSQLRRVTQVVTTDTSVTLDRAVLVDGHTYAIAMVAQSGFPHAADGDFVTKTYPFTSTSNFSHTFTVQP